MHYLKANLCLYYKRGLHTGGEAQRCVASRTTRGIAHKDKSRNRTPDALSQFMASNILKSWCCASRLVCNPLKPKAQCVECGEMLSRGARDGD